MSEEKPNVPKLRFPGFADPWEQRKFSDLFSYERPDAYIVNNDEYDDSNPTPVLTANKGFILGYTAETRTHEGPCVIFDDFTLDCKLVTFPFMVKSSAMKILHCHDGVDLTFAYERLCSAKIEALGHARHYISVVQNTESAIPSYEEQSAIGRVLSNLDTLITLHQRKLDHLKEMKKGLLQKMFPKNGESIPELRFPGFTDPWEQRKLAELIKTITTGKSVNSDEGEVSDGDIGVLKTSCVSYDRFNSSESKPVVKSEQQLVKCAVEKDSVIVSRMNTPERVGACGYVSTDFPNLFLPDRLWKLKFQDTVDTYFVYMMLVSGAYKEKITSMASGTSGSMYNIPKETFLNLQLVIPAKIDEQKQLGKILKKIDTLITLHQREHIKSILEVKLVKRNE